MCVPGHVRRAGAKARAFDMRVLRFCFYVRGSRLCFVDFEGVACSPSLYSLPPFLPSSLPPSLPLPLSLLPPSLSLSLSLSPSLPPCLSLSSLSLKKALLGLAELVSYREHILENTFSPCCTGSAWLGRPRAQQHQPVQQGENVFSRMCSLYDTSQCSKLAPPEQRRRRSKTCAKSCLLTASHKHT